MCIDDSRKTSSKQGGMRERAPSSHTFSYTWDARAHEGSHRKLRPLLTDVEWHGPQLAAARGQKRWSVACDLKVALAPRVVAIAGWRG